MITIMAALAFKSFLAFRFFFLSDVGFQHFGIQFGQIQFPFFFTFFCLLFTFLRLISRIFIRIAFVFSFSASASSWSWSSSSQGAFLFFAFRVWAPLLSSVRVRDRTRTHDSQIANFTRLSSTSTDSRFDLEPTFRRSNQSSRCLSLSSFHVHFHFTICFRFLLFLFPFTSTNSFFLLLLLFNWITLFNMRSLSTRQSEIDGNHLPSVRTKKKRKKKDNIWILHIVCILIVVNRSQYGFIWRNTCLAQFRNSKSIDRKSMTLCRVRCSLDNEFNIEGRVRSTCSTIWARSIIIFRFLIVSFSLCVCVCASLPLRPFNSLDAGTILKTNGRLNQFVSMFFAFALDQSDSTRVVTSARHRRFNQIHTQH